MRIEKSHKKLPAVRRGEVLTIWVDGVAITAYAGETIAAVLAAEGIVAYRYSERPDGEKLPAFFCGMGICYGCVVLVDGRLRRACLTAVEDGMRVVSGGPRAASEAEAARGQEGSESLAGSASAATVQTEIAVVGAGPAGMQAAVAAAELGLEVTLIDGYAQAGGQYFKQMPDVFKSTRKSKRQKEAEKLIEQLQRPEITRMSSTRVWDIGPGWRLELLGPDGLRQLQSQAVVLAAGAYDRPAAFPGWTLPGVMSVGAAQHLVKLQRILPGCKILVAGSGPLLLALAALLVWAADALGQAQEAEVVAVVEGSKELARLKPARMATLWGQGARLREGLNYIGALRGAGVPYRRGWGIVRVLGDEKVEGAVLAELDDAWRPVPGSEQTVSCDTICIGYGLVPETALGRLAGAHHIFRPRLGGWVPERDEVLQSTVPGLFIAGDGAGIGGAAQAAVEGRIAGMAAAVHAAGDYFSAKDLQKWLAREKKDLKGAQDFQKLFGELFTPGPGLDALADNETIICRCESVKLAAVQEAVKMGAQTAGAVKGLTRAGMGECQGRICGALLAGQVARLCGKEVAEVGSFRVRPPLQPLDIDEF